MSVEVKICGLTNSEDAAAALEMGADYIGFIFYAGSPRAVKPAAVSAIVGALPMCRAVGVFVNDTRERVECVARDCGLYAVQLHGDEKAESFTGMPLPLWRATNFSADAWAPDPDGWQAARYLIDASTPHLYGGTGKCADWQAARRFAGKYPVMLAGGLNPDNVQDAIRTVRPLGVDVGSGVEAKPGRKDHARMKLFIERAKSVALTRKAE